MSAQNFKNVCLMLTGILILNSGQGQVVFGTETFGSGSAAGTSANGFAGGLGTWTTATSGANGASANQWYVSGEECGNAVNTCGSVCSGGDNSLHISAIGGLCGTPDCGAAYDETSGANQTNSRAVSPTIDCTGKSGIVLNFNYIAAQADDGFFVEYSLNNGSTWTTFTGGNVPASLCCPCNDAFLCAFLGMCCGGAPAVCSGMDQGYWTASSLSFPAGADNNPNVKFAFNWSNDGNGIGTDPSVAIDDITLTYDAVLSVELTTFKGVAEENVNRLFWTTASELNTDYFEVQHSYDGAHFYPAGSVPAAGNSSSNLDYSFLHETDREVNYYRLKIVDHNGQISFSDVLVLHNDLSGIILSRFDGHFVIKGIEDAEGFVQLFDISGKLVTDPIQFSRGTSELPLNLEHLQEGIYIIDVHSSQGSKKFKILI